jgi:hypothetical protein
MAQHIAIDFTGKIIPTALGHVNLGYAFALVAHADAAKGLACALVLFAG